MSLSAYASTVAKQLYDGQTAEKAYMKEHAFLAMVKKEENFGGDNYPQPVQYGYAGGRSATFSVAQARKQNGKYKKFFLERFSDYSIVSIKNEDAEACMGDKTAFVNLMKREMDGGYENATDSCARDIYSSGDALMGVIAATTVLASPTLVLATADDAFKFEEGMYITLASANNNSTPLRNAGSSLKVIAVNRNTGTLTLSANISTITGAALADFIFLEGDKEAATGQSLKMPGIFGWVPDSDPTGGDSFFTVDRSIDPERLAGVRLDGSSLSIEEGIIKIVSELSRRKSKTSHAFMHYNDWTNLEISLGSKVQYVDVNGKDAYASIGFRGIKLQTPKGIVTVLPDAYARLGRVAVVDMSTWYLKSLKKAIRVLNLDGKEFLREGNADAIEYRIGGYKVLGCKNPAHNGNLKLY